MPAKKRGTIGPLSRRSRITSAAPAPSSNTLNAVTPYRPPSAVNTLLRSTSAPLRTWTSSVPESANASTS